MPFIKNGRTRKDYVAMSTEHLQEKDMSLTAKGLMSFLLSKPEGKLYSLVDILESNSDDLDSIMSAIKELESFGYIESSSIPHPQGGMLDVFYTINEYKGV